MHISLVIQWLRLYASTAGVTGSIPVGELRSHMPWGVAKKKKTVRIPFDPLLGIYPTYIPAHVRNEIHIVFVIHCSTVCNGIMMETTKCTSKQIWLIKVWYIYMAEHCAAVEKKTKALTTLIWKDLQAILLSEE